MRVESIQVRRGRLGRCRTASVPDGRTLPVAAALVAMLLLASAVAAQEATEPGPGSAPSPQEAPSPDSNAPAPAEATDEEPAASVSGSVTSRATVGGGPDRLSTRLGLDWLAGRWAGGFSAEFSSETSDGAILGRSGVGSFDLPERWVSFRSRGDRPLELRLGTARGITFGQGLVLGSPTFDGIELLAPITQRQSLTFVAGRTESLDVDDFEENLDPFAPPRDLGDDGDLTGLRHETRMGTGVLGLSLLRASTDGAPAIGLAGVDFAFSRGLVDFASEFATLDTGGFGAYARLTLSPADAVGITLEGRRYSDFSSPLDSAPRYEGLSAADPRDETGGVLRVDFAPTSKLSGTVSFDYSNGGDPALLKSSVRRDTRLALRWALAERTSLSYGFELEDLSTGRDGRIHSLALTHAFKKYGRLSTRLSKDGSTEDRRESFRASWRLPLNGRKVTVLADATLRREETLTKEFQAGVSLRLGASSFLTARVTVADDSPESLDVTWYRRF